MTPTALTDIIAADRLAGCQAAIVSTLQALLPGIAVKGHAGKIDISAMVARSIVAAPGVAVGWSQIRGVQVIDGTIETIVDWAAYIVVEHKVIGGVRVERERIGFAIARQVLLILADRDTSNWGLTRVAPPSDAPPPSVRPLFTLDDEQTGTGYLAVTWSQSLIDQGVGLFAGPAPEMDAVDDDEDRASIEADFGDEAGDVPLDVRSLWKEGEP